MLAHDGMSHFGVKKSRKMIARKFFLARVESRSRVLCEILSGMSAEEKGNRR